jgi:predicted membrane channel-forming protein YqfA (hemolysin III family)
MSFQEDFETPKKRKLRGILYIVLGLSAGLPIFQMYLFPEPLKGFENKPDISLWVYGGASYVLGASIYIIRFPEKYFEGYFDNFVNYI